VAERSGLQRHEIERRMSLQMSAADKTARADYPIDNNGSLESLQLRAEKLWAELNGEAEIR
jgi:dephospho-CoA kinase